MDTITKLNDALKVRGTTMCLGLNSLNPLSIFTAKKERELTMPVLIVPTSVLIISEEISYITESIKWKVVNVDSDRLPKRILALFPESKANSLIGLNNDSESSTLLSTIANKLYLYNLWVIDTFPFNSGKNRNLIRKLKEECEQDNIEFGVALGAGLHKYGSTDISTEEEAITKEIEELAEEGTETIIINQKLIPIQYRAFFTPMSSRLHLAKLKYKEDCAKTHDSLIEMEALLPTIFSIELDTPLHVHIQKLKEQIQTFSPLLPIVDYLDDEFYIKYESSISTIYSKLKPANLQNISDKCTSKLIDLIKAWINNSIDSNR